jgi:hypothetical protein
MCVSFQLKSVPCDLVIDGDTDHGIIYSTFCGESDWNFRVLEGYSFRCFYTHKSEVRITRIPGESFCRDIIVEVTLQHTIDKLWRFGYLWVDVQVQVAVSKHICLWEFVVEEEC